MSFMLVMSAGMSLYGAGINSLDDGTCWRILRELFYLALSNNDKKVALHIIVYQTRFSSKAMSFLAIDDDTINNIANNAYVMTYNLTEAGQKNPKMIDALGTIDDLFSLLNFLQDTVLAISIHKAPDYENLVEQLRILKKEDPAFNAKYVSKFKNLDFLAVLDKADQAAPSVPKAPGGPVIKGE